MDGCGDTDLGLFSFDQSKFWSCLMRDFLSECVLFHVQGYKRIKTESTSTPHFSSIITKFLRKQLQEDGVLHTHATAMVRSIPHVVENHGRYGCYRYFRTFPFIALKTLYANTRQMAELNCVILRFRNDNLVNHSRRILFVLLYRAYRPKFSFPLVKTSTDQLDPSSHY